MKKEKFVKAYLNTPPLPIEDIATARQIESRRSKMAARIIFPGTIDNIVIETEAGSSRLRVYTPQGAGPFPVIVYMHGGGFSVGSSETSDNLCRAIAEKAQAILVSVDYRLAPEHKFPAALEECYQVALWCANNDIHLNILSDQMVIAGDSAGGNLAAAICLLNQTRQELVLCHQLLICPLLDQHTPHADKITRVADPLLTTENCQTFSRYYFNHPEEAKNPLASPLLAPDLVGLPAATIITAELDPLAREAYHYGKKLWQAGVEITHFHYPGQVHDFPLFIKTLDDAKGVTDKIGAHLVSLFSSHKD